MSIGLHGIHTARVALNRERRRNTRKLLTVAKSIICVGLSVVLCNGEEVCVLKVDVPAAKKLHVLRREKGDC